MAKRSFVSILSMLAFPASVLLSQPAQAQSVVFLNPGKSEEAYWRTATKAMEAAARSLKMNFRTEFAERDPEKAIAEATKIAALPTERQPDYVIVVNERDTGIKLLSIFRSTRSKLIFAFSGISSPNDRRTAGEARQRNPHWIGTIEANAFNAGYDTAKSLLAKAREMKLAAADGKIHVLGIRGDFSTPTSIYRNEGMMSAVKEAPDAVIDDQVYAEFNRAKAAEMAEQLFAKHANAKVVWAASDQMAFGAMQALEKRGGQPGKDVIFSGVNTSTEALDAIGSGRLAALSGGHFVVGAWALVLIYDYHHGIDFKDSEGLELSPEVFTLFDAKRAETFKARFGQDDFTSVDFRIFSKVENPALKKYRFGFGELLK